MASGNLAKTKRYQEFWIFTTDHRLGLDSCWPWGRGRIHEEGQWKHSGALGWSGSAAVRESVSISGCSLCNALHVFPIFFPSCYSFYLIHAEQFKRKVTDVPSIASCWLFFFVLNCTCRYRGLQWSTSLSSSGSLPVFRMFGGRRTRTW